MLVTTAYLVIACYTLLYVINITFDVFYIFIDRISTTIFKGRLTTVKAALGDLRTKNALDYLVKMFPNIIITINCMVMLVFGDNIVGSLYVVISIWVLFIISKRSKFVEKVVFPKGRKMLETTLLMWVVTVAVVLKETQVFFI